MIAALGRFAGSGIPVPSRPSAAELRAFCAAAWRPELTAWAEFRRQASKTAHKWLTCWFYSGAGRAGPASCSAG
jgi:hypothetical protein